RPRRGLHSSAAAAGTHAPPRGPRGTEASARTKGRSRSTRGAPRLSRTPDPYAHSTRLVGARLSPDPREPRRPRAPPELPGARSIAASRHSSVMPQPTELHFLRIHGPPSRLAPLQPATNVG